MLPTFIKRFYKTPVEEIYAVYIKKTALPKYRGLLGSYDISTKNRPILVKEDLETPGLLKPLLSCTSHPQATKNTQLITTKSNITGNTGVTQYVSKLESNFKIDKNDVKVIQASKDFINDNIESINTINTKFYNDLDSDENI